MAKNFEIYFKGIEKLLKRTRDIKEYKRIIKILWDNKDNLDGLSAKKISIDKGIYSKLGLLEEKKIINNTLKIAPRKMLVDLDIDEKPCFNEEQIEEKTSSYGGLLLDHSLKDSSIMEVIISILGYSNSKMIENFLMNFLNKGKLKEFNLIIDALKTRNLYDLSKGYGRLEWRPQQVNKYILIY